MSDEHWTFEGEPLAGSHWIWSRTSSADDVPANESGVWAELEAQVQILFSGSRGFEVDMDGQGRSWTEDEYGNRTYRRLSRRQARRHVDFVLGTWVWRTLFARKRKTQTGEGASNDAGER